MESQSEHAPIIVTDEEWSNRHLQDIRMEYAITEQMDITEWAELLANSQDATIFHTYEWMKLLHENSMYNQQLFITARNGTGKLMGWMPFVIILRKKVAYELISLPNSAGGGVVIVDDVNEHTRETLRENILKAFCDFGRRFSCIRILNRLLVVDFLNKHGYSASNGFRRKSVFSYILELDGSLESILMNRIDKKTRSQIRQAMRKGVTVKEATMFEVGILSEMFRDTARRHRLSPVPETELTRNIQNVFKTMGEKKMAKYLIAYHDGAPLACALQLMYKDSVFYAGNASYERYWRLRPNNLLVWTMIENGLRSGCRTLNFGSVRPGETGLLKFKESWGAKRVYFSVYEKSSLLLRLGLLIKHNT